MNGRLENENKINEKIDLKLLNMPECVKRWEMNLRAEDKTAASRRDFVNKVYHFLEFIDSDVKNIDVEYITKEQISDYFISIQTKEKNGSIIYTSDSYKQGVWFCLNNFFEYLYESNVIEENYIKKIKKSKNKDLIRINQNRIRLTEKDFNNIINAIKAEKNQIQKNRDLAILLLFMTTGMRRTALSEINVEDIDFSTNTLIITDKGDKLQDYYLDQVTIKALKDWLNVRYYYLKDVDVNALFVSNQGKRMSGNNIYKIVQKYSDIGLGYSISPHKLRGGVVSILYSKEHNIEKVRRAIGHANVATTQRYIVTDNTERKQMSQTISNMICV